jgi:hypothetical protein
VNIDYNISYPLAVISDNAKRIAAALGQHVEADARPRDRELLDCIAMLERTVASAEAAAAHAKTLRRRFKAELRASERQIKRDVAAMFRS